MIATAEVVRRIVRARTPILLPDTCALLDLVREPIREGFTGAHVEAALRLIARATARPATLRIAIAHQVLTELQEHRVSIEQGAEAAVKKLEDTVHRVQAIMTALGLPTSAPGLVNARLPPAAQALVQEFLDVAMHVGSPRGIHGKAYARIAANIAPAQKGQQAKDCIVLESYLQLAREARQSGVAEPIVFFTTNTRDYSDGTNKGAAHPTLVDEFAALDVRYAVNFGMAEHLLG